MRPIRPIITFIAGALTVCTAVATAELLTVEAAPAPSPAPAPAPAPAPGPAPPPAEEIDTTYQPLEPCRLLDTRPSSTVGPRATPLGPGEVATFQVTGANGNCPLVSEKSSAVALNVTVAQGSERSFLTIYPSGVATPPTASHLNWVAGQAPTPNKVDVKLSDSGEINVQNAFGSVHVIVDVAGVYLPNVLDDIEARLDELESAATPALFSGQSLLTTVSNVRSSVVSVDVTSEQSGRVMVTGSTTVSETTAGDDVGCRVTTTPNSPTSWDSFDASFEVPGPTLGSTSGLGDLGVITDMAVFEHAAGATTYHLACTQTLAGSATALSADLVAVFVPD